MCIEAKNARCWKYSPADTHTPFPLSSTFQHNRNAVATGLSFINTLCTQSERSLPTPDTDGKQQESSNRTTKGKDWILFS